MPFDEASLEPLVDPAQLPAMIVPAKTALVIIDVQEDFISPTGAGANWGIDMSVFEPQLDKIETLIAKARAAGVAQVFVRVVTSADTDSDALKLLHQRKGRPPEALAICRAGTPGADYYRIKPEAGDIEIAKTLYSSFSGTDLDAQLKARGIDTVIVVGFTTECCVESTARDAFHHNYSVFVVTDATAAYEEALHYGSLNALAKNCALLTDTASVLSAWS